MLLRNRSFALMSRHSPFLGRSLLSTNAAPGPADTKSNTEQPNASGLMNKARGLFKKYGKTGLATLVVVDALTITGIYAGIRNGMDVSALFEWLPFGEETLTDAGEERRVAKKSGEFALAYFFYKLLTPFRLGLTALITPPIRKAITRHRRGQSSITKDKT